MYQLATSLNFLFDVSRKASLFGFPPLQEYEETDAGEVKEGPSGYGSIVASVKRDSSLSATGAKKVCSYRLITSFIVLQFFFYN